MAKSAKKTTKTTKKTTVISSQNSKTTYKLSKDAEANLAEKKKNKYKVKKVLITQPQPTVEKTPYHELARKYNFKLEFIPMTTIEGITVREFRKNKVNIPDFSAIIFNSKNAIDFFFEMCDKIRHKMPQQTKYYCSSEIIAFYLQKYIQYRKRKVIFADGSKENFQELLLKNKSNDKFLYPCSAHGIGVIPQFLKSKKFDYSEVLMFKTVPNEEFKEIKVNHDLVVFFNSDSAKSFDMIAGESVKKNKILFGGFGINTQKTMKSLGMEPIVNAPQGQVLSISMAIDKVLRDNQDLVAKRTRKS